MTLGNLLAVTGASADRMAKAILRTRNQRMRQ